MAIVRNDEERLLGRCMPKGEPDDLPPMRPQPLGRVLVPVVKGRDIQAAINAGIEAMQATAPEGHSLKRGWEVRDPDIRIGYTPPEFTADDLIFAHCVNLGHEKFRPKGGKPKNGPGPIVHKPCPAQRAVTRHQHRLATARDNNIG